MIFSLQKVTILTYQGHSPQHTTSSRPLPGRLHHHILQLPGPAAVQVRNLWGVVLTWLFYVVCTVFSSVLLCRMANIIDYLSDGLYEGEDMDTEAPDDGVVDIPSSETEGGNLGDVDEKDSSILNSSSDSPLRQNVPSVGPGNGYTAETAPMDQSGSQTIASVSSTHVSVGRVTSAGVRITEEEAEMPSLRCSAHPKSWQQGCVVCDQALLLSSKTTNIDPKMAVTDRLL